MLIEINNLYKTFGNNENNMITAVNNLSLSIKSGSFTAIAGPSGCGKTTLINIIAGLLHPDSGSVVIDGISLYENLNQDGLALFRSEYIGFVFQSFHLIPYLTALENCMIPIANKSFNNKEKRQMAEEALLKVGLSDKLNSLPSELSGGQAQRAAIARSIVNNPLILLADEPTGNLDSKNRDDIISLLENLKNTGKTVIYITHDSENIRRADRVVMMLDGKIS